MSELTDILIELLPEFDLPEPESDYLLDREGQSMRLLIAFPEQRLGLREGPVGKESISEWTVWSCLNENEARIACKEIADAMGIQPTVLRLDFSPVHGLLGADQLDAAQNRLQELQDSIDAAHPDWPACEELRTEIRKARKKRKKAIQAEATAPEIPKTSFPELLRKDAARLTPPEDIPEFSIVGFYSPNDESDSTVDGVWVAQCKPGEIEVWAACLEGNPAYQVDSKWETVPTEADLLDGLLERCSGSGIVVWHAEPKLRLLRNWHYRIKGMELELSAPLVDLQKWSLVALPNGYRSDIPEALCKQRGLPFQNEMGLGGPLAAMLALISATREALHQLSDTTRQTLRKLLSLAKDLPLWDASEEEDGALGVEILNDAWLERFLPAPIQDPTQSYEQELAAYFQALVSPLQESKGNADAAIPSPEDFLKAGGYIEEVGNFGYRERAEQLDFSTKVAEGLASANPHVLEAGTGIGKTIGYLVPSLLSGKKTLVSTHTKALQDQAWDKDIPLVLQAMKRAGVGRQVAMIKGKANYVCLQTVADWLDDPLHVLKSGEEVFFFAAVLNWLLHTQTGWLSEIEHLGHSDLSRLLGRDQAPPKLMDQWVDIDPHAKAREAARRADLVLANHSFVFSIVQGGEPESNKVDNVILDEAHNIDEVVTEVLTLTFNPWALLGETNSLIKRDRDQKPQGLYRLLLEHSDRNSNEYIMDFNRDLLAFEDAVAGWCGAARKRLNTQFPDAEDADPDFPKVFKNDEFWVDRLYQSAKDLKELTENLASSIDRLMENIDEISGLPKRIRGSLAKFRVSLNECFDALKKLFEQDEAFVRWGEARLRFSADHAPLRDSSGEYAWTVKLYCTPVDIAGWLHDTFRQRYEHRIFLSATLTVGGEFGGILRRFGLDREEPVTGIYVSPFDFKKQALLAVPHDMPPQNYRLKIDPRYIEDQTAHIGELAVQSGGRMLVLFTSRLIMREAAIRLQSILAKHDILVLTQQDANRTALIERLRQAPRKGEKIVLLGLRAFWEGIDVSGSGLSVLVITKLPFAYHEHPVAQARQRLYENTHHDADYFSEQVIPNVFLHLRQMYGRLIRNESDRGCTVITDARIYTRRYGRVLLGKLPETTTVVDKRPVVAQAVRDFLDGKEVQSSYVLSELPVDSTELSPEQKSVVASPAKRILVRAAAGSGKTHVLITRIIRMIDEGHAKPEEILAMTYTVKGMKVMYERIEKALGSEHSFAMNRNILTYHRMATRIIRDDDSQNNQETAFIDEKDPTIQEAIFDDARKIAGLTKDGLSNEDARTMIAYAQNGLINRQELETSLSEWEKENRMQAKFGRFYLEYARLLDEKGLIDYGEAIVRAVHILRSDKERAQQWCNRFKWIFCDEYQDTTPAQATMLQLLGQQADLFIVGDNNQSIYSWQGSDPDNLRRFEKDFPNTSSHYLSKNYRCYPNLVRYSAAFLKNAGQAIGAKIDFDERRSSEDQSVFYLHNGNDRDEAKHICKIATKALQLEIPGDPPPKATVGILARKWGILDTLERELISRGLSYRFEGETARGLLASPRLGQIIDRAAELITQNEAGHAFGDSGLARVGKSLSDRCIQDPVRLLNAVRSAMPGEPLDESEGKRFDVLLALLKESDFKNIKSLSSTGREDIRIVLSTVHSQKGEEFDTVIVLGLEQGNSPHDKPPAHQNLLEWRKRVQSLSHSTWRAKTTDDDLRDMYIQEEKRIFYVAMTRARHNLIISRAEERQLFSKNNKFKKSEFLEYEYEDSLVKETQSEYQQISLKSPEPILKPSGYRGEDRKYETATGIHVRSKSEMLLANEFTRQEVLYTYEEPIAESPWALPDFKFPDYPNVLLEHFGLLDDTTYWQKAQEKLEEYENIGWTALYTTEDDIKSLTECVSKIKDQLNSLK